VFFADFLDVVIAMDASELIFGCMSWFKNARLAGDCGEAIGEAATLSRVRI
jgi:hypothetical protein